MAVHVVAYHVVMLKVSGRLETAEQARYQEGSFREGRGGGIGEGGRERERENYVGLIIIFSISVRRTILPRGSYKFATKKKLSTQLTVPSAQPQFELSLSKLCILLFAGVSACAYL